MQWLMLQQEQPEDYVIATGVQYSVRHFVELAARQLGVSLEFEGQGTQEVGRVAKVEGKRANLKPGDVIVRVDPRYFRPTEVDTLLGDASKARGKLGWTPATTLTELVAEMVEVDYTAAKRDSPVKLAWIPGLRSQRVVMILQRIAQAVVRRVPPHAMDQVEEFLLGLRDFERLATQRESALTIVCDDGEIADLEIVEVLESRGVKGVFAVSPDLIGRPGFLTYDQLRDMRAAGHEIAFHGTTHDPFTAYGDSRRLLESVRDGMRRLHAEGLGVPSTLIYPFGSNNRAVRKAVSTVFDCAFTTWFGLNERKCNRFAIRRVPFGSYTGRLPATEEWYRSLLDRSSAGSCWPTLMLHPSGPGHDKAHDVMLGRLIDHAQERGIPVRTVSAHRGAPALAGPSSRAAGAVRSR